MAGFPLCAADHGESCPSKDACLRWAERVKAGKNQTYAAFDPHGEDRCYAYIPTREAGR